MPDKCDKYFRLFDANANRCREGLRVIEDTARFVLGSEFLYKKARKLRHSVDKITRSLHFDLVRKRDSISDSGRKIREGKREDLLAVTASNFKRVEESLRVLEEYSRLIKPEAGPKFKKLRFSVYSFEKRFLKAYAPA